MFYANTALCHLRTLNAHSERLARNINEQFYKIVGCGCVQGLIPLCVHISLMASDQAGLLLRKQLKELLKNPVEGFSAGLVDEGNVYEWEVVIMGPPDTL